MRDTDWRPSKCPECGVFRSAQKNPICKNRLCLEYEVVSVDKKIRQKKRANKSITSQEACIALDTLHRYYNQPARSMPTAMMQVLDQSFRDVIKTSPFKD